MSVAGLSSNAAGSAQASGVRRRVRTPIVTAKAGDHQAIYYFLREIFGGPSRAAFHGLVADPFYEPHDRLLLRRMGRIVAHVHLTHRVMQFGPVQVPVAGLDWLAVAANCRRQGLGSHLLLAAQRQMARSGILIGLLRTRAPLFFRRSGWAVCGRHSSCIADAHALLGRLLQRGVRPGRHHRLQIRPWRRWEEAGLMRVYNQNLPGNYGPLERTRAYWQWLLQRRAFDQLYVALDGPNLWDLDESTTQLVGYAAIKGQAVIELMTVPGRPKAAMELLARIAGEAIEQDRSSVVLHAPAASPLLAIFDEADGWRRDREVFDGEVYMARLVNPLGVLRRLSGEFFRRAAEAQLPRPLELGLSVEGQRYQIEIDRDRAAVAADQLGRSYLRLNVAEFTRLVLGQLDWDQALAEGRLDPSTALARQTGQVLFPPLPLWRPPLDELMA